MAAQTTPWRFPSTRSEADSVGADERRSSTPGRVGTPEGSRGDALGVHGARDVAAALDFTAVYREHQGRVLGAVRSILGASDEIEDVVQLAFLEIHRNLGRFEGRSRLSTWIYRVAVNVALQHLRKKKRKRWLVLGITGEEAGRCASGGDAERRLADREALEHVYQALDALTEKKRTVWVLHELQGLSPRDIAEVLEIPTNTARSRLLAARRDLFAELRRRGVLAADEGQGGHT